MEKYPWAATRTSAVAVSDEHPFIAAAFTAARKQHLRFRQRQFQTAYLEQFEKTRQSILKKGIEMNDRHAISLRINAALGVGTPGSEKTRRRLSYGGVRRWIEGIDDNPIWEDDEYSEGHMYDPVRNNSITALRI
jgi:hypothetical protein